MSERIVDIKDCKAGDVLVAAVVDGVRDGWRNSWIVVMAPTTRASGSCLGCLTIGICRLDAKGDVLDPDLVYPYSCYSGKVYVDDRRPEFPKSKLDALVEAEALVPVLIDGLSRAKCLARYTAYQAHDKAGVCIDGKTTWSSRPGKLLGGGFHLDLTPAQLTVAKEEWSAQVRAKRLAAEAEARRKEYQALAVDDDRWEVD